MDENRVRKANMIVRIGSAVILAIVLGYMLYEVLVVKPETVGLGYKIIIAGGVIAIWVLGDVFAPWYTKEFSVKTEEQISAYKKYAALGLLGYGGLVYFASTIDRQTGFYGALVFVFANMMKRKQKEIYDGIEDDEDEEEEESLSSEETVTGIEGEVAAQSEEGMQEETVEKTAEPVKEKSVMAAYQSAMRLASSVEETDAITYEIEDAPASDHSDDRQAE